MLTLSSGFVVPPPPPPPPRHPAPTPPHGRKAFRMFTMRLLAFMVALFAVTQAEEGARLLASKSLLNRYAVEGRDLTLQYNIYNVGSSAALDVELSDDSFPPEDFGIVSGMLNVKWDRIAPYPPDTGLASPVRLDRAGSWLSGSSIGDSHRTFWTGQPLGS
ncbi:translocon-associated protein subunit beta isoform X4 [Phyllostomus discolor]|uniref:Translocon-associated protein subunit beta isoform X4 n=1 Tax=Phyllostomus discolor TaxID=89673 RepID=A0A7E6CXU8_9CHIR|nr:translocon-associated protein subunit beta isoform X4 [Phyllostomus discolor]